MSNINLKPIIMQAYYYCIFKNATGESVDQGIIKNSEDTIYPKQNTGIEELPFECPCNRFKAKDYTIKGFNIDIPVRDIIKYRVRYIYL